MLPFDSRANFASTLMFEKISNFSKKYFFYRSKNMLPDFGEIFENLTKFPNFFKVSIVPLTPAAFTSPLTPAVFTSPTQSAEQLAAARRENIHTNETQA